MIVAPDSLRARKQRRTRDAIVDGAIRLFAERGFDRTSVADIAAAAEVGHRTFFRYFADKEEVLFAGDAEILAALSAGLDTAPVGAPPLAVAYRAGRAAAQVLAGWADRAPTRERIIRAAPRLHARTLAKYDRYATEIERRLIGTHRTEPAQARLAAAVAVTCVRVAYQDWVTDTGRDLPALVDTTFAHLAAVTGAPAPPVGDPAPPA
ncbi:MAG TPA: TetR family transcriptional regulator [Frankiaceae bacterium]|nr:TetR family transcriptional regulator [Frankiaceae bacterium]